jgi:proteasome lid subunit RPN8/RPN11
MILLSSSIREAIFTHACEGYPNEVCGLLVGKSSGVNFTACREAIDAIRVENIEEEMPKIRYKMNPDDMAKGSALARQKGLDIIGFYHSHPDHPAQASQTDLENSSPWGGYSYPIVSVIGGTVADFRCWYREGEAWIEEPVTII